MKAHQAERENTAFLHAIHTGKGPDTFLWGYEATGGRKSRRKYDLGPAHRREAAIEKLRVDRDNCFYCNARADIGCGCNTRTKVRVSDIVSIAADMAGMLPSDITGPSRLPRFMRIRFACYLVAREQGWSFPEIGMRVNRHHTSVIHGRERAEIMCWREPEYRGFVETLRARSGAAPRFISEKLRASFALMSTPKAIDEPIEAPVASAETEEDTLDDMDLLSSRVAAHYGSGEDAA